MATQPSHSQFLQPATCVEARDMEFKTQDDGDKPSRYAIGVLDAAFSKGLSDISTINPHVVRKNLKPKSKGAYNQEWRVWGGYCRPP